MKRSLHALISASLVCAGLAASTVMAATEISDQPLINTTTTTKPNLMFILDDSGSMARAYMPDDASDTNKYMYWSYQCNGLQYNPSVTYPLPVTSTGASYPNMGFASAWDDGFKASLNSTTTSSTSLDMGVNTATGTTKVVTVGSTSNYSVGNTVVLRDSNDSYRWMLGTVSSKTTTTATILFTFSTSSSAVTNNSWTLGKPNGTSLNNSVYYTYAGSQPLLGWTYASNKADTNSDFYKECDKTKDTDNTTFPKQTVTTASTYTQNYANWYSYYRKRYLMARSAGGRALVGLNSNYRVGFTIISDEDSVKPGSNNFVDILDFSDSQKITFYSNLYQVEPGGYTPLRTALRKTGKYYANKYADQTDPIQHACQRNYALLTTDGYWNDDTTYVKQLDDSTDIGEQDGTESKPMWDGQVNQVTVKTTTVSSTIDTSTTNTTTVYPTTAQVEIKNCTKSGRYYTCTKVTTPGTGDRTVVTKTVSATTVTTTTVNTVVTTNGTETSNTTVSTPKTTTSGPTTTTVSDNTATFVATGSPASTSYTGCKNCSNPTGITYTTGTTVVTADGPNVVRTTTGPTTTKSTTTTKTGGSSNSLADVAEYFYATDLRTSALNNCTSGATGEDVCNNEVLPSGRDTQTAQHMTTFTLGFGVNGTLTYDPNYLTQTSGTYVDLVNGTKTWPVPTGDTPTAVDDLWHAAVNGRGQYFSASNPTVLANSLATVISSISKVNGAGAAAASSSLKPVQGEDQIYVGSYTTLEWTGDLQAQTINENPGTKEIYFSDAWSAKAKLAGRAYTSRRILYRGTDATTTSGLAPFDYTHLSADGLSSHFTNFCSKPTVPDQCATLTSTQQTAASGANLVNYLRGDQTNEATTTGPLYRSRVTVLGDIVGSGPVYMGKPPFKYADEGYSDFVTANVSRTPMVYVAANDGMLHAFSAATADDGVEQWAYIPTMAMANLYRLADTGYANRHRFMLDGTPVMGDIKVGSTWKTILVGGLSAAGTGYYALDVTDPANPKSLWEFTDADMGKTFGNPIITKLADGTWVVVFTSGFNNTGPGYLYVVNANTGVQISKIETKDSSNNTVGTASAPANLGEINAWIDNVTDNTAKRIYGGDMLGNLWRFDISSLVEPHLGALQLAKFQIGSGSPVTYKPQPITTRPELAYVKYGSTKYPVVLVGTGRYLGSSDITDTLQQSMYAIKDPLTSTGWGDVRANSALFSQTITATSTTATSTSTSLDWSTKLGWKFDFPLSRERLNTDMTLQYTTLVFSTTVPESTVCTPAGSSWDYTIDIVNGQVDGERAGNYMTVGISTIALTTDGATRLITLRRKHTGETSWKPGATPPKDSVRRTSWRELVE